MQATDTLLVEQCRGGDRNAFAEIVRRYQTLVCSIAYAATSNLSVSEEIAQEALRGRGILVGVMAPSPSISADFENASASRLEGGLDPRSRFRINSLLRHQVVSALTSNRRILLMQVSD